MSETTNVEELPFSDISIKSHLIGAIEKFDKMYHASENCSDLTTGLSDF